MDPATLATLAAGASAVSGIAKIFGGLSAASDAKKAARTQARLGQKVTSAKLEDLFAQERVMKGQTIAAVAGSGVKYSPEQETNSPMEILMEQARNFARERKTVAEVGAMESKQTIQRGNMVASQAIWSGVSGGIADMSSAFSMAPGYVGKQKGAG